MISFIRCNLTYITLIVIKQIEINLICCAWFSEGCCVCEANGIVCVEQMARVYNCENLDIKKELHTWCSNDK